MCTMYFDQTHPLCYSPLVPPHPGFFKQYLAGFIMLPTLVVFTLFGNILKDVLRLTGRPVVATLRSEK
jgi:hypothetical protein